MFIIETSNFNKAARYKTGHGYGLRAATPASIVIHSTNNPNKNTAFANEARFLFEASDVSAHFLVGKDGRIVQFLDPAKHAAWHAGSAVAMFGNDASIGIELHHSVGEVYTGQQFAALTWLCQRLMQQFAISAERIATHRAIALPAGRKTDPSDWSDDDFYAWRARLAPQPTTQTRVIGTKPSVTLAQFINWLHKYKAPISAIDAEHVFSLAADLDIDPAFIAAIWRHETFANGQIGGSELFKKSNNAGAIRAYGRWPSVRHNNADWNRYESPQLGLMHLVMHLKQFYGADRQFYHVETIIPIYAPAADGNAPAAYIAAVLKYMTEMVV